MNPFAFVGEILSPVTNIAGKMIMDKDAYAELQFKKVELREKRLSKLLTITTTPRIDALVKLLYAIKDVVIPMFRPLGSIAMAGFSAYCVINDITLPSYLTEALFAPGVLWGYSRHKEKQAKSPPAFDDYE